MHTFNINYFVHAANILSLVAYSVRDILWLRLFAILATLIAMPYFLLQPKPLWPSVAWGAVFIAINGFRSWRLLLERRPVKLAPDEEEVRRLIFPNVPPRKILQALSIGTWIKLEAGERLIEYGKPVSSLSLIVSGKVQVSKLEQVLGVLGKGDLVGSALLLSGVVADVDALTLEPTSMLQWELDPLEKFLNSNPEVRHALQRHLSHDLAGKVQRLGSTVSEHSRTP
jgi:hypothetical protein